MLISHGSQRLHVTQITMSLWLTDLNVFMAHDSQCLHVTRISISLCHTDLTDLTDLPMLRMAHGCHFYASLEVKESHNQELP